MNDYKRRIEQARPGQIIPMVREVDITCPVEYFAKLSDYGRKKHCCMLESRDYLTEGDAGELTFADNSFDTTVAMYVMTVVPEPEKVMRELARVTKPGGEVMLVNHFSQEEGVRGWVERRMAPFAELIGWLPVIELAVILILLFETLNQFYKLSI